MPCVDCRFHLVCVIFAATRALCELHGPIFLSGTCDSLSAGDSASRLWPVAVAGTSDSTRRYAFGYMAVRALYSLGLRPAL